MPEVSIIVPVYNVQNYLNECVDSILSQSFNDFELILVDDGSSDKSGAICDRYAAMRNSVTVIHQENSGQAAARNRGVEKALGKWVMFVDSDDVIHTDLLDYLYRAASESGAGMAVSRRVKAAKLPKGFFEKRPFAYHTEDVTKQKLEEYFDRDEFFFWAPFPSLIKSEIVRGIPFPEGRIYEDNAVSCQMVYAAERLAVVPYEMYYYRDNPNGTMNLPLTEKKLDYLWALETQIEFFERIQHLSLCKKVSSALVEAAVLYCRKSEEENNARLNKIAVRRLSQIMKKYGSYIGGDKNLLRKTDRILHPRVYRIKKIMKIY